MATPEAYWREAPGAARSRVTDLCFECGHTRDLHFDNELGCRAVSKCGCRLFPPRFVVASYWDPGENKLVWGGA